MSNVIDVNNDKKDSEVTFETHTIEKVFKDSQGIQELKLEDIPDEFHDNVYFITGEIKLYVREFTFVNYPSSKDELLSFLKAHHGELFKEVGIEYKATS